MILSTDSKTIDEEVKKCEGKALDASKPANHASTEKIEKIMKEATKHHGDVQAKLDAAAPYFFFLTAVTDSPKTHMEHLTITFTGRTKSWYHLSNL